MLSIISELDYSWREIKSCVEIIRGVQHREYMARMRTES